MTARRLLTSALALPLALALVLGACVGDDGEATDTTDTTDPAVGSVATTEADTTATSRVTDPATDGTATDGAGTAAGDDAAGEAVATVFDSSLPLDDEMALIAGGEAHRADHDAYVAGAESGAWRSSRPTSPWRGILRR